MASKPFGQIGIRSLRMLLLAVVASGLSGCEVGRTMFQFSSGSSSPWVGIDLLPRKAKTTKISHKQVVEKHNSQQREQQLISDSKPNMTQFAKKPIRLNLPASEGKKASLKNGDVPATGTFNF